MIKSPAESNHLFNCFENGVNKTIREFTNGDFQMMKHLESLRKCYQQLFNESAGQPAMQGRLKSGWEKLISVVHFKGSIEAVKAIETKIRDISDDPVHNEILFDQCLVEYRQITAGLDQEFQSSKQGDVEIKIANDLRSRAYQTILQFDIERSKHLPIPESPVNTISPCAVIQQYRTQILQSRDPWPIKSDSSDSCSCDNDKFVSSLKVPYDRILNNLYLGNGIGLLAAADCNLQSIFQPDFADVEESLNQLRMVEDANFDSIISITNILSILNEDWVDLPKFLEQNQEMSIQDRLRSKSIEWLCIGTVMDEPSPTNWKQFVASCSAVSTSAPRFDELSIIDQFEPTFKRLDEAVFGTKKVLVHCQAGVSRSSSLVAAYLINRFEVSANEAIAFLHTKRYCVKPKFILWLDRYASAIKEKKSGG